MQPAYYRPASCGLLRSSKLERPVFGGRNGNALLVAFRVAREATVTVTVRDAKGKVVRRFPARTYGEGVTHRLRVRSSLVPRGLVRVTIEAQRGQTRLATVMTAKRL